LKKAEPAWKTLEISGLEVKAIEIYEAGSSVIAVKQPKGGTIGFPKKTQGFPIS
jgi:hypothetical protein